MKCKITHNLGCAALLTALSLLVSPALFAASLCSTLEPAPAVLELRQGVHQEFHLPVPIRRLAVGNPEIADVKVTSRNSFLVLGLASGVTNISVWTQCAKAPRQSMVFIAGEALTALTQVVAVDDSQAALPSQVQTDIRFVEVNRTKLKEIGISLYGKGSNGKVITSPGGSFFDPATGALPNLLGDGFNIAWGGGSKKYLGALNALEKSGFAYTLSRPSLVALSGQSASFLAGGEFPVPVPSSGSDSISIEYKPYGIKLNLTPTVIDRNRIHLKVAPEVSELDFNSGIVIQGTAVPSLNVRRTDTSISLADGESFVISGLMSTRNIAEVNKLPGLGNIPVLGAFFRNTTNSTEERELLMIVTPHLVNPLAADARLPELPGESLRQYDPSAFEMLLLEDGSFDRHNGLSW
ncbi:MAG: type II and III secretion system protein family protein [Pseudomonas sp.]|jgi:pilus assembly protein CpaC|nr:type II and III secretion system protein family protein [Pseudomonas sp.]MDD2223735.1 type II and III secretion system protein family protein [Pseudomonas sp.]MDY0415705.1 type II and III secretion system protein family protein [Pseudomonas sp.]